ncbi:uncharacterized protein [Diadema setosum]|uniref:uncharacterized protein n=1 Tax=Diadema setosum TaxID=31175 RepID=UPI003B3A6124
MPAITETINCHTCGAVFQHWTNLYRHKRIYHPSDNHTHHMCDICGKITDQTSFDSFLNDLEKADYLEYARQQRPNSKWTVQRITNLSFYIYPLRDFPIGCQRGSLPDYIIRNRSILDHSLMNLDENTNLCFFRCLAAHLHKKKRRTERLTLKYYRRYTSESPKSFKGVKLSELDEMEQLFHVNIVVFELAKTNEDDPRTGNEEEKVVARVIRRSVKRYDDTMYLNLYNDHFSYITDIQKYSKRFECRKCGKLWKRSGRLVRHEASCESNGTRTVYPGGVYVTPPTVFEELDGEGIPVMQSDRYFPYFAVFDFECFLRSLQNTDNMEKMELLNEHVPASVSICSNVPGYESPQCLVSNGDPAALVADMVAYLHEISSGSREIMEERFLPIFQMIDQKIETMRKLADNMKPTPTGPEDKVIPKVKFLTKLKHRLTGFMQELPVLGFNSGKYDINTIKKYLYPALLSSDPITFVVKRNNNHMAVKTENLKFLDILNYLAPGFSYDSFLKAYHCAQKKGFFPYEWFDCLDKLDHPTLPPHEAFHTSLKNGNISVEEYAYCQQVWTENGMSTMRDFLAWYNNRDVQPFVEAVKKMISFYSERGIDMFKDGISVPGLTMKYLMKATPLNTHFSLIHRKDADLFQAMKKNLVGGPSIVFTRYHEQGVTKIRGGKICQKVVGYDANALYLWAIMQDMPTGPYVRRMSDQQFKPKTKLSMAQEWLTYKSYTNEITIRHAGNNTEKRVGPRNVPVDGYCAETNTVYQFQGCWWHGHDCTLNAGKDYNVRRRRSMRDLFTETQEMNDYIRKCGYNLVEMWECDYRRKRKSDIGLKRFLAQFRRPLHNKAKMAEDEIMNAVMSDKLFGVIECDIHVPESMKPVFAEMCPIFKHADIGMADIGDFMKTVAEKHGFMKTATRSLIGSMFGEKVMIITPLLQW